MRTAPKTRAKKPKINKAALLKDLRELLRIHQFSGRTWELSVLRDTIKFLRQK